MSADLIILIAAIIVTGLIFIWLLKVVKAGIKTAILIAAVVLVLQLVFGIGPGDLWQQVVELWQSLWQWVPGQR